MWQKKKLANDNRKGMFDKLQLKLKLTMMHACGTLGEKAKLNCFQGAESDDSDVKSGHPPKKK